MRTGLPMIATMLALAAAPATARAEAIDDIVVYLDGVEMLVGHLPDYPRSALREGLSGEVVVAFLVVDGGIEELRLIASSDERFTEAVRKVVYSWLVESDREAWRASGLCAIERRGAQVIFDADSARVQLAPLQIEPLESAFIQQDLSAEQVEALSWPVLERYVPPTVPGRAAQKGLIGSAAVTFTVDTDGRVRDADVVESAPDESFGNQALRAVKQWRYQPATVDGRAVPVRMCVREDISPHDDRELEFWGRFTRESPAVLEGDGGG